MQQEYFSLARIVATVSVSIFILSGCTSDDDDFATAQVVEDADDTIEMTLSGSVGDGPVVNGSIVLRNSSGTIIDSQTSDASARYEMTVDVLPDEFPLIVSVADGTDLVTGSVPDFPLLGAVPAHADGQVVNLNPMSTLVVKLSQRMDGGPTAENLADANLKVRSVLNFGLDTALFPDAMTTDVHDENLANVVRASEAFGEMVRRTRDALISGGVTNAEQVLDALSADLVDGVLDGRGSSGVVPRITAVSNIVSAQVTLETMANRLRVGGVEATDRLDDAIRQVAPDNPAVPLTGSIGVSEELLEQARVLLDAAIQYESDGILTGLHDALILVEPGQSQQELPELLRSNLSDTLDTNVLRVSLATDEQIGDFNDAVRDGSAGTGEDTNSPPTISGKPVTEVIAGSWFEFRPAVGDPDNDPLTFSISGKPSWVDFDSATGRVSGRPGEGDVGAYPGIRITVSDGSEPVTLPAFSIEVVSGEPANREPSIGGTAPGLVYADTEYDFRPVASDPDDDVLIFWISGKPSWASFDPATGRLSGVPDASDVGTYGGIHISVSDDSGASVALPVFAITVAVEGPVNRAPTISGSGAAEVTAGSPYSFTPTAGDPDGDPLTFRIAGKPSWASFDSGSGRLSGTPGDAHVDSYPGIWITVSDDEGASTTLPAFTITVSERPNRVPSIGGSPDTQVDVGTHWEFTPSASDPDDDPLTFSISNRPFWASFNAATGRLAGTPETEGTWSEIRIGVSDGEDSVSLPAFSITANGLPNRAPSIGGSPAREVMVDNGYGFTPTASDPDDDPLVFSISGKPAWADFDSATGRLSGTPRAGDVGTYAGIRISVSDGEAGASLDAFTVEVVAQALGSATVSWLAPTLNEDGSVLTDLAGFKVFYGTTVDSMDSVATIDNPSVTTYLVENLHAGTWYFKVRAFDTAGNESADSEIGSKLLQP